MYFNKRKRALLIISVVLTGALMTGAFFYNQEDKDFKLSKNLDIYLSLFRELRTFYVDEIDPEKLVETSINSMLSTLDPYTVYYPEDEAGDLDFITTGKYGGFGSLIRKSGDYIVVTNVYKGFPAEKNGIKPGDLMISIDGKSLKGVSSDKASEMLKGDPGTGSELVLRRNGKDFAVKLVREKIYIPAVPYYGMLDATTGYIRFTNFTQNCISEVRDALTDLKDNHGAKALILDLRNNPGGLVTEAVEIVNLFVGSGQEVVSTHGRVRQYDAVFRTQKEPLAPDMPLVIMINRASASAAEIVAGSIQDLDRGVIIGERSYGKGLVQIARPLSYRAQVKLTTAKYYIPSGRCIQAVDFSHRNEDGSVGHIPDSLIKSFKTKTGREVKDGGGIIPDISVNPDTVARFVAELYLQNMVFDYATVYYWSHQPPSTQEAFHLDEDDIENFRKFLTEKNFGYKTDTEKALETLITVAKSEGLFENNKQTIDTLMNGVSHNMESDFNKYRKDIKELIETELIDRYFYDAGAIRYSLSNDNQIEQALKLFTDHTLYTSILTPAVN